MKRILLTGFGPFGDHPVNPTEQVVRILDGQTVGEYHVVGRVLPVVFQEAGPEYKGYLSANGRVSVHPGARRARPSWRHCQQHPGEDGPKRSGL